MILTGSLKFWRTTTNILAIILQRVVGATLEDQVQETVMKAMAEMAHTYFLKVVANHSSDMLDLSEIIIPPC